MTIAILMLQPFARQRGAAGSATNQETTRTRVSRRPDQIANPLEAKHGVKNEEGDRGNAMRGISSAASDKRGHRAGLGDALFEDLPVGRFLVIQQRLAIHRIIELADVRIDSHLPE